MPETFTLAERAALAPYVTNLDDQVFALKNLPEEVVAVLFAYYSRSPHSLRRNLLKLLEEGDLDVTGAATIEENDGEKLTAAREKARAFHEKWVVGYGHGSVAEHGIVHLAIEDVSILASKLIEDARLASYTEKSTRYVAFDPSKLYTPPEIASNQEISDAYRDTLTHLLDAYTNWTEEFVTRVKARNPKTEKQTERGWETASRATTFDILRYLLPAATHTNIGLTVNARTLEHLITKLLSQPLTEGRALGIKLKSEAQHIVPTLLKYADYSAFRDEVAPPAPKFGGGSFGKASPGGEGLSSALAPPNLGAGGAVSLLFHDPDADNRLVAAILYAHSQMPMAELLARVTAMDFDGKARVVDDYVKNRGKHDAVGRAFERLACTMEMTMDYGAYRDVQRHRLATQTLQTLSPALGFATPPEIVEFGFQSSYDALMERAAITYQKMADAGFSREAVYVLPLATRVRVLFTWNLREVTHFVELRSARQGHPSYRKIAQDVFREIERVYPLISRCMRPNLNSYGLTRD